MKNADYWISNLQLIKHPEGGYFKETYRSSEIIKNNALNIRYNGDRNVSTSIYFLLKSDEFSAFHCIKSDETWHFYSGSPIELIIITPEGKLLKQTLGNNPKNNEFFQFTILRNHWFAAMCIESDSYSLVGCSVAPGFDFKDFSLATKNELATKFPQHKTLIDKYCIITK